VTLNIGDTVRHPVSRSECVMVGIEGAWAQVRWLAGFSLVRVADLEAKPCLDDVDDVIEFLAQAKGLDSNSKEFLDWWYSINRWHLTP
jgi:hypothetical protein